MKLSRRSFLQGLGVTIALPSFDIFSALNCQASSTVRRVVFIYTPNGIYMPDWTPKELGPDFNFPEILKPLEPLREELTVITGLTLDAARAKEDGPGDHARASGTFLTGQRIKKTSGNGIYAQQSVDQVIADNYQEECRFPSLELGCEASKPSGRCDADYSCVYVNNLSWRNPTSPLPKEVRPRMVFERLFAVGSPSAHRERLAKRKSILDYVRGQAGEIKTRLGASDTRKLDEYLTNIRSVERRIEHDERSHPSETPALSIAGGVPADFNVHAQLMCDLTALAFHNDSTRVVTLMLAYEGSNRSYPTVGVPEGHHDLSHHGNDPAKIESLKRIDRFHVEQVAYLLQKLKTTTDAGGASLLEQTMVLYGSGISDGQNHTHDNLPILLAGGGINPLRRPRHLQFPTETPLCNLFVSTLNLMGVNRNKFGDSTGALSI